MKRVVVCLTLLGILFGMTPSQAYACNQTSECGSENIEVQCDRPNIYESHYYHQVMEPSGYIAACTITTLDGTHKTYCSGCKALLSTDFRQCLEEHTHEDCYDRYHICGGVNSPGPVNSNN